jgi:hypothetical protein
VRLAFVVVLLLGCVDTTRPGELAPSDTGGNSGSGGSPVDADATGGNGGGGWLGSGGEPGEGGGAGGGNEPMGGAGGDNSVGRVLKNNGEDCAMGAECISNRCVDGVCCNEACDGTCVACNTTTNRGWCAVISAGLDPANECPTDATTTCGSDGSCDGRGACRRYPAGTSCGAAICQAGTATGASACDGLGACVRGATHACPSGMCMGTGCAEPCTSNANCQADSFCEGGKCQPKRATGIACTSASQCATSFCVDGVCCSSACTLQCLSCNLAGSVGSCTPIPAGQDPASECPAEAASTCGRRGGCNGAGSCERYAAGTICKTQSCTSANVTGAGQCSIKGACVVPSPVSCGAYQCNGNACGTTCGSSSQCTGSNVCSGSSCMAACVPENNAGFCARLGKNCGQVNGTDNCGTFRSVSSCGSCSPPQYCNGGGTGVCGGNAAPCAPTYAKAKCTTYVKNTRVSFGGRNWSCITHDCANCGASDNCAPAAYNCPWGIVWQDEGVCL